MGRTLLAALAVTVTLPAMARAEEWTGDQREVWQTIETSSDLFFKEDLEGYMGRFHDDFLGWGILYPVPTSKAGRRPGFAQLEDMVEEKTTTGRRVGLWALGAIGTLIVGLAAAWLIYFFGPGPEKEYTPPDPCAKYKPLEPAYVQEIVDQAQKDVRGTLPTKELVRESIEVGHFLMWVADCGKVQAVYERDFTRTSYRVTPYTPYQDRDGRECRELAVNRKMDGRWHGSSAVYCRIGGKWSPIPKE